MYWLLSLLFLCSDQGPASSGTADAAEGRETTAATKQHTTERLVHSTHLCILDCIIAYLHNYSLIANPL